MKFGHFGMISTCKIKKNTQNGYSLEYNLLATFYKKEQQ